MRRLPTGVLLTALLAGSCGLGDGSANPAPDRSTTTAAAAPARPATFTVLRSAEQVTVTGSAPGATLSLQRDDLALDTVADALGNAMWRQVAAGAGYTIHETTAAGIATSESFEVPALTDRPDPELYTDQTIEPGYGYLRTRDGTLLSINVTLPGLVEDGPYPTVIEYSGYDLSNPESIEPATGIAQQAGFATVAVNMRGSGCSGGAFDYFEPLQSLDGYDAVEAVAAQPWVLGHRVGMIGVSYSGISQLFVAATNPPSLAAITPLSVLEDVYRSVLYPGGIYNDGFAQQWATARQNDTAAQGQNWVADRIAAGDTVCEANQLLRSLNNDLVEAARARPFYDPAVSDDLAPRTFVGQIDVPVFLAGAWQDEQTGGRFATMLDDFTDAPVFKAIVYNGAHADSLSPEILIRWYEFLNLYVADRAPPPLSPALRVVAPAGYEQAYGVGGLSIPADRFAGTEPLADARSTFEADPNITVLVEMGGSPVAIGGPAPRGRFGVDSWPPTDSEAVTWSLGVDGSLTDGPAAASVDDDLEGAEPATQRFEIDLDDAHERQTSSDGDSNPFDNLSWPIPEPGTALAYESDPFDRDRVLAGSGTLDLALVIGAGDVDVEVTVSEVRPDGTEVYVQSGWLRASHRSLDPEETTDLLPVHLHTESGVAPTEPGDIVLLPIEIFPVAHVFRTGSRLRITVDTPGGSRNLWTFDTIDTDGQIVTVWPAASELRLPFLSGVQLPAGYPPCPGLRSQPCRPAPAIVNASPT